MEIERKFLISKMPSDLNQYDVRHIVQGYISADPVIRIRHSRLHKAGCSAPCEEHYTLTVKGRGLMVREEMNLPLSKESFDRLSSKTEGRVITKDRYLIPLDGKGRDGLVCELDVFREELAPLVLAEVEFPTQEAAEAFEAPSWFGEDVTDNPQFQNVSMCGIL